MDRDPFKHSAHPSADSYRTLVESITDYAIYMLDRDGRIANWNAGAQRFKGYSAEEIIGAHFSRFYTDEDRAAGMPERALRTAAEEGRFEAQGWRVRKDGRRFWAHVVIDPIRDPAGELVGYAKITRDLTERRAAEDELRKSQEQFRLLVEGVTDYAIYMLDPTGHVASWNAGAERIKGYTRDEILGAHFSRFYRPEDRARGEPERALETARSEGRFASEAWRMRKDGTLFHASVVIDAIHDEDGALIGFAKITRDVTEREETQRQLEQAREALFQSQKMDAIGQLTGGVAHDFNNLLMAIIGSLDLLRTRLPDDPRAFRLLDNALEGARRGATLTQRMLAFARRQELKTERVEVSALVHGMADLLRRSIGPEWPIESRFPVQLSAVMADANQLEMALLNLVVNARDAMEGGGRITIRAHEETIDEDPSDDLRPGRYVCLSVTDTGSGMDADTLARATEPFFTTKGVGKGTGLGLPMILGFAGQTGGTFRLKSEPGQGTTAELWLRVAETTDVAEAAPIHDEPAAPARPLTILAVDDDPLVLMNTSAMLEDLGHTVIEANTGEEGLEKFSANGGIDLVITDQAMPAMSGLELARAIRMARADMPIIIATGYGELPEEPGLQTFRLGKPFGLGNLAKAVAEASASRVSDDEVSRDG